MTNNKQINKQQLEQEIFKINDVSKTYQGNTVLNVDELNIYTGEILGLVGPSGAGKSTLLRLLNFVEASDTGEIVYMGTSYRNDKFPDLETRRQITTVFQRPYLLTTSVWNNIVYPLKIRQMKIAEDQIKEIVENLGLTDLINQRADKLSGGEAQRVSLARSLVFGPKVLLLDEPTSNLDPTNVKIIEDILARYVKEHDITVIMVTHNVFQAKRLADRVALMFKGELVEVNDKDTFFNNPENDMTERFISGELIF